MALLRLLAVLLGVLVTLAMLGWGRTVLAMQQQLVTKAAEIPTKTYTCMFNRIISESPTNISKAGRVYALKGLALPQALNGQSFSAGAAVPEIKIDSTISP